MSRVLAPRSVHYDGSCVGNCVIASGQPVSCHMLEWWVRSDSNEPASPIGLRFNLWVEISLHRLSSKGVCSKQIRPSMLIESGTPIERKSETDIRHQCQRILPECARKRPLGTHLEIENISPKKTRKRLDGPTILGQGGRLGLRQVSDLFRFSQITSRR